MLFLTYDPRPQNAGDPVDPTQYEFGVVRARSVGDARQLFADYARIDPSIIGVTSFALTDTEDGVLLYSDRGTMRMRPGTTELAL